MVRANPHVELNTRRMRAAEVFTPEPGWRNRANCRGQEPEQFFPGTGGSGTKTAHRLCRACSESMSCLATALLLGEDCNGVWGDVNETERKRFFRLRSRERRNAKGRAARAAAKRAPAKEEATA